jgi:hypothetical protein
MQRRTISQLALESMEAKDSAQLLVFIQGVNSDFKILKKWQYCKA